ncbi:MAG TPA: MtrB/PioB family outer membrane beta-barrel protein, partial [Methylomirabilota bacterium]|nr:MtrB/PioB family outer membrane beta-barrel protein [Methylomirabilota bacterium]
MRARTAVRLIVAVGALLGWAGPAWAQTEIGGLRLEGDVEAGVRFFADDPNDRRKQKLEEYEDWGPGLFFDHLRLRLYRPDERYFLEASGAKWGREDQSFSFLSGRLGRWEFGFDWDQTPHILSTNARTLATEIQRGIWALPATRPSLFDHNQDPNLNEVGVRWDTARMYFTVSPTPELDLTAKYERIRKEG